MKIQGLVLSLGLLCWFSVKPAAEWQDDWVDIAATATPDTNLHISYEGTIPLKMSYTTDGKTISTLAGPQYAIANPRATGPITLTVQVPSQLEFVRSFAGHPLGQAISSLVFASAPGWAGQLYNTVKSRGGATITIDPRQYSPGTILIIYWPMWMVALGYDPMIIPLKDAQALQQWYNIQSYFDQLVRQSKTVTAFTSNMLWQWLRSINRIVQPVTQQQIHAVGEQVGPIIMSPEYGTTIGRGIIEDYKP